MGKYSFYDACDVLETGQPYSLESVATVWRNFAEACRSAAAHTQGTADKVTEQYGKPYQAFGDRAAPIASWLTGVGSQADKVSAGLSTVSKTGNGAQMEMYEQRYNVDQAWEDAEQNGALSAGRVQVAQHKTDAAATVLNGKINEWSSAYNAFQPGEVTPAPTTTTGTVSNPGSTGTGGVNGGNTHATGGTAPLLAGAAVGAVGGVSRGSSTQSGKLIDSTGPIQDTSHSSVVGDNGGDFAGWVRDPRTGYLIDPSTGREFDPTSGRWIDPVTGKPFGDVQQYTTRLEGLGGGPGGGQLIGTPAGGGLIVGGPGSVDLAPLLSNPVGPGGPATIWNGQLPPSLYQGNPAFNQLTQRAITSMTGKAYAAQQLAFKESMQGGRPYLPPTQAGGGLFGGPGGGRSRGRLIYESRNTWTGRRGQLGLPGGERATAKAGAVPAAASGRGRNPYLPPSSGAGEDKGKRRRKRPEWSVEDDVWSVDRPAGPAVLGEQD